MPGIDLIQQIAVVVGIAALVSLVIVFAYAIWFTNANKQNRED